MKKSFSEIFSRNLSNVFLFSILAFLMLFYVIYAIFSQRIYENTLDIVKFMTEDIINETNMELKKIEEVYDLKMDSELRKFYRTMPSDLTDPYLDEFTNQLLHQLNKDGIETAKIQNVNYYLINPDGIIMKSNFSADIGLDLSKYPLIFDKLVNLKSGEILASNISQEIKTNQLRSYYYLRLPNQDILEIGLLFDQNIFSELSSEIKAYVDKDPYIDRLDIFNWHYYSYIDGSKLSLSEREVIEKISQQQTIEEISESPFKKTYYMMIGKDQDVHTKYIRFTVDYYPLRMLFLFFIVILMVHLLCMLFLRFFIMKEINKRLRPFQYLIKEMKAFSANKKINPQPTLEDSYSMVEADELITTFKNMAGEITLSFNEIAAMNTELEEAYSVNDSLLNKLSITLELIKQMPSDISMEDFLLHVYEVAVKFIPEGDYASISIVRGDKWEFLAAKGHDLKKLKEIPLKVEYLIDIDQVQVVENVQDINQSLLPEEIVHGFSQASKPIRYSLFCPFKTEKHWYGNLSVDIDWNSSKNFSQESIKFMEQLSNIVTGFLVIKESKQIDMNFRNGIIFSLIKALELYDKYTEGHSQNVAELSAKIAKKMELPEDKVNSVYWSGLVHDIGKILIDKEVLNKDGRLTNEEYEKIKMHPVFGYDILNQVKEMKGVARIVRYHHERFDGRGYPDGLIGAEIPVESRIISLADAWDAMSSNRSYRRTLSKSEALDEIKRNRGSQFDPEITDIFLEIMESVD